MLIAQLQPTGILCLHMLMTRLRYVVVYRKDVLRMQEQLRHKDGIIARMEEEKDLLASKSEIYNSGRFKVVYIISARYRS